MRGCAWMYYEYVVRKKMRTAASAATRIFLENRIMAALEHKISV
ncbi:MAG TPA: hypothetical protein VJ841_01200 [Candidatus Saccharimonadales bacterium]|nr:hypothetical protein [Candidatus Saccharimonadales bacterium]